MKLTKLRSLALLGLVLGASACEKDILDVNTDPNNPTSADISLVLPSGQAFVSFIVGGQYNILGEILSQHMGIPSGANQYRTWDQYNIPSSTLDARQFQGLYAGALEDFQSVIDQGAPKSEFRMTGIAKILQAHSFQILTDFYGDIPFSEALKPGETTTPKFDRQQDVYRGLQTLLTDGINDIKKQQGKFPGAADLNYKAGTETDMSKWVRLANTLKLKMYLRLSERDAAAAEAGVRALYAANPDWMRNSADSFTFANLAATNADNPFYQANFRLPGNLAGSTTIGDTMVTLQDPRLPVYFLDADLATPATAEYRFVRPGQTVYPNNFALTTGGALDAKRYSFPGTFFIGQRFTQNNIAGGTGAFASYAATDAPARSRPTLLLTYDESLFLRAEAAARGWASTADNANAAQLYNDAVTAAMARFAITGAPVTTYLAKPSVSFTAAADLTARLKRIYFQKWLSFYGTNGAEAWTEVRRTNTPPMRAPIVNVLGAGNFVKRLPYPDSEINRNPNFSTLGLAPGDIQTPVWWDAN
jgi:hypothetical protein